MYVTNFVIPLNKDELLESGGSDQYCVRNVVPLNVLSSCLSDCRDALKDEGADFILQHFDTLYSFLVHFKDLDLSLIGRAWDLVANGFAQLISTLSVLLEDASNPDGGDSGQKDGADKGTSSAMDSETRTRNLNTLRMLTYIYSQMLVHCEDRVAKKNLMAPPETKKGRKKGKNAIGGLEDEEDQFDCDDKRQAFLAHVYSILQLPLNRLWDPPVAEEEFINLIANCCYKILEDTTIANARFRHIRESIFQVLGTLIKRYSHGLSCSLKIVQLLKIYEHTSIPLAQGVIAFAGPPLSCRSMVREVLREISETDPGEFAADASGTRAICHFLTELAIGLPALVQSSISLILPILDFESYTMRICVLGVLTEIVSQLFNGVDLDEAAKASRDSFLDELENHMHDVNAFVRSKVLQYWQRLCREKAIPLTRQHDVLEKAVGRLSDKSNLVRKYSLQLVRAFLEGNPFAVKLGLKDMLSQLEIEKKTLSELMTKYGLQDKEPVAAKEAPKRDEAKLKAEWKKIEPNILEAIYNYLDQGTEGNEADDKDMIESSLKLPLDKLFEKLISFLLEEKYEVVAHLLFVSKKKHPKAAEIRLSEDGNDEVELSDGEEKGEPEDVMSDEDDSPVKEKKRAQKMKKRMKYLGKLMRKIFLENHPGETVEGEVAEKDEDKTNADKEGNDPVEGGEKETNPIEPTQELDCQAMEKIQTQTALVQFLEDSVVFVRLVSEMALPRICCLLSSDASTDVLEAIDFFTSAFLFGLTEAKTGVREMLRLVFSKDAAVKDAVVGAYAKLYLSPDNIAVTEPAEGEENPEEEEAPQAGARQNPRTRAVRIVKNLTGLVIGANICERDSIEELVREWVISEDIDGHCIKVLWERFSGALAGTTPNESRAAAVLLGMAAGAEVQTIWTNLDVMVKVGLKGERGQPDDGGERIEPAFDSLMVCEVCEALLKMALTHKKKQDPLDPPLRLLSDHTIFTTLCDIIIKGLWDFEDSYFSPMASLAIDVIYQMAEKPDSICGQIIKDICMEIKDKYLGGKGNEGNDGDKKESQPLTQGSTEDEGKPKELMGPPAPPPPLNTMQIPNPVLARLMFVVGHVAFREFVYLDTQVFTELKRRNNVREKIQEKDQAGKKGKQKSKRSGGSANMSSKTLSVSASEKSRHEVSKSEDGEDDVIGAVADDAEAEFIRNVCEMELVGGNNLLSLLCPLVVTVCAKPKRYHDSSLRVSVVLALSKYMCVSSVICQRYMQLLVTMMEQSPESVIRANCIIALGDLCYRFPNITEPWSPNLYGRLRDMSEKVRQNTLMVLTHLIMNDMVKVKGQISDMALCILDPCEKIRGLTKLFFQELAQKGNALYNVMTDIISRLSNPSLGVPEKSFQTILSFLIQLITKDRLVDSLVEKLCQRFQTTGSGALMDNAPEAPKMNPSSEVAVSDGQEKNTPTESQQNPTQPGSEDNANEENESGKPDSQEIKRSSEVGKDAREEEEKRQWRDLAFCLSLLPYNSERAIRRLMSHLPCYADKITKEPQVYSSFMSIVEAAKKAAKAEMKAAVDEFEQKIEECIKTADEEGNVPDVIRKTVQTPAKRINNGVPRSVTKSARPRRKIVASSSSESDFESAAEDKGKKPQSVVKSVQKRRGRGKQRADSDEEDVQPPARSKRNPRRKVTYDESGSEKENKGKSSDEEGVPSPEPKKPKRGTRAAPRAARK
ncbi:condensin complex subunit 1 [Ischnura elegans]|uniref:condensin complex subunit 1 n=1 Tax=Ischnura elegans TaxID=197161 RepID=UPI001ED86B25|nr:condensin complex subunit 1 [Ischnura elegans]